MQFLRPGKLKLNHDLYQRHTIMHKTPVLTQSLYLFLKYLKYVSYKPCVFHLDRSMCFVQISIDDH